MTPQDFVRLRLGAFVAVPGADLETASSSKKSIARQPRA